MLVQFKIVPEVAKTILSSLHCFYFIWLFSSYFHHFISQLTWYVLLLQIFCYWFFSRVLLISVIVCVCVCVCFISVCLFFNYSRSLIILGLLIDSYIFSILFSRFFYHLYYHYSQFFFRYFTYFLFIYFYLCISSLFLHLCNISLSFHKFFLNLLLMIGFVFLSFLLFGWGVLHRVLLVVGWCCIQVVSFVGVLTIWYSLGLGVLWF